MAISSRASILLRWASRLAAIAIRRSRQAFRSLFQVAWSKFSSLGTGLPQEAMIKRRAIKITRLYRSSMALFFADQRKPTNRYQTIGGGNEIHFNRAMPYKS